MLGPSSDESQSDSDNDVKKSDLLKDKAIKIAEQLQKKDEYALALSKGVFKPKSPGLLKFLSE